VSRKVGVEGGQALPFVWNPKSAHFAPVPDGLAQDLVRWQRLSGSPREPITRPPLIASRPYSPAGMNSASRIRMRLSGLHQSLSTKFGSHPFLPPPASGAYTSLRRDHVFLDSLPGRCRPVDLLPALDHILGASKQRASASRIRLSVAKSVGKGIGLGPGTICKRFSPGVCVPLVYFLRRTGPNRALLNETQWPGWRRRIHTSDFMGERECRDPAWSPASPLRPRT